MDLHVYTLSAKNQKETPYPESEFWSEDYEEAKSRAMEAHLMVIDNTYTWEDSEMIDDFTE